MNIRKGGTHFESNSTPLLRKVIALLAELKQTRNGSILHDHISLSLEELDLTHAKVEHAYASFITLILEACASQLSDDSPLLTHIKLVQTRLTPPISLIELSSLTQCVEAMVDEIAVGGEFNQESMEDLLSPMLGQFLTPGLDREQSAQKQFESDERLNPGRQNARFKVKRHRHEQRFEKSEHEHEQAQPKNIDAPRRVLKEGAIDAGGKEVLYRDYELDDGEELTESDDEQITGAQNNANNAKANEDPSQLQKEFIDQMRGAIAQSEEFGIQLNVEIEALHAAKNIRDIEARRNSVLTSLEKLSEDHRLLAQEFNKAQDFLFVLESDHQQMTDELHRVRMLSLTDELTSLPNRRAFMRRLEDEVSRVQRYGYPLALVLLDIDHFKNINDKYGHNGGDAVLRLFAEKVLSMFRHHDMVARYGGEEFAVLLPNTDMRGVLRAFNKIRKRAEDLSCTVNGVVIKAPTFSAGLAEYRAGETPSHLIERADNALYRAKRLGRNRIEVQVKEDMEDELEEAVESESV